MYKLIDVSEFNGPVNWEQVKKDGYKAAMVRIGGRFWGSGKIYTDSRYSENLRGAINSGLHTGVYFYTQAITEKEAIEEAEFCINLLKNYKIDMPIAIDTEINRPGEERLATITPEKRTACTIAFMDHIIKAGYKTMFYCGYYYLHDRLVPNKLKLYDMWLAQWTNEPYCDREYSIWQYSSKGQVNGISGNVDINNGYKEYWNISPGKKPWEEYDDKTKVQAVDVLLGRYGNGEERVKNLGKDYDKVQSLVNVIVDLFII